MCFAEKNGKYIEGYFSDKENFNGILFILREPNTKNQGEFFFRNKLLEGKKNNYINIFQKLIESVDGSKDIKDAAFANIRSNDGEGKISNAYTKISKDDKAERVKDLISCCGAKKVFICWDVYNSVLNSDLFGEKVECNNDGICYSNNRQKRKFIIKENDIEIYEIYHPSYLIRSKIQIISKK